MSLNKVSIFYVLGEDSAHRSFIIAWLRANNVHTRKIHLIEPPANKTGGIGFVLTSCKKTVDDARHRDQTKGKTRVIVAIDADDGTVEERLSAINLAIGADDEEYLICALIPKRHIETWVHALGSPQSPVNESNNYKVKTTEEVRAAARCLARLQSAPPDPPSLILGYEQLQRLKAT